MKHSAILLLVILFVSGHEAKASTTFQTNSNAPITNKEWCKSILTSAKEYTLDHASHIGDHFIKTPDSKELNSIKKNRIPFFDQAYDTNNAMMTLYLEVLAKPIQVRGDLKIDKKGNNITHYATIAILGQGNDGKDYIFILKPSYKRIVTGYPHTTSPENFY